MTRLSYAFALTAVTGILAGGLFVPTAKGQDSSGTKTESAATTAGPGVAVTTRGSVSQTVGKLKKMIAHNGMMVMGQLNQGRVLSMTGIQVKSQTLFVGNPQIGKQLFSADPGVGLVVPIRINVYENAYGQTVVQYVPPSRDLNQFHDAQITMIGNMLDQKLKGITSMLGQ